MYILGNAQICEREVSMTVYDLRERGFDVDSALELCVGSEEIYLEVLETALEEGLEKIPFIKECVEKEDFKRYGIEVHGLKNAARQIGANELSDLAFEQEKAAKADNYEYIKGTYEALLTHYQKTMGVLKELLG